MRHSSDPLTCHYPGTPGSSGQQPLDGKAVSNGTCIWVSPVSTVDKEPQNKSHPSLFPMFLFPQAQHCFSRAIKIFFFKHGSNTYFEKEPAKSEVWKTNNHKPCLAGELPAIPKMPTNSMSSVQDSQPRWVPALSWNVKTVANKRIGAHGICCVVYRRWLANKTAMFLICLLTCADLRYVIDSCQENCRCYGLRGQSGVF